VAVLDQLTSAATAIAAHDIAGALDHLLDAFAVTRSHELRSAIDACSKRMSRWRMPDVGYGNEIAVWEMQADSCHPADLGAILAAAPTRAPEVVVRVAARRRQRDPRLGDAVRGDRGVIAYHGDDLALARLDPSIAVDTPLDDRDRAALAVVMRALDTTPPDLVVETIGSIAPAAVDDVRALVRGEYAPIRDLAAAAPSLFRLLDTPGHPARLAVLAQLAAPWHDRDFFERFPDLDSPLANIVGAGWGAYLRLIDDPDPRIQAATLRVLAHLHVPLRGDTLAHLFLERNRAPELRAAFVIAAGRADIDHRLRSWPVDDPAPIVRFAAAVCVALATRYSVSRETLAIIEAPPPDPDPAWFPWFDGDLAAMSRAVLAWLELPPIEGTIDALVARIGAGTSWPDDHTAEWQARRLALRVFGTNPPANGPTDLQRRVLALLAFYHSTALDDLHLTPPDAGEIRRLLGIAGRPLRTTKPHRPFDAWRLDDSDMLDRTYTSPTEIPGIDFVSDGTHVAFVRTRIDLDTTDNALEGSGVVALSGDPRLARWLTGHRCESLRILDLWGNEPDFADAPILGQLRWLRLRASPHVPAVLASPRLTSLELLDVIGTRDLTALATLPSPLRKLVVNGELSIEAIAANESFALEDLVVETATLHGAGTFAKLRRLRAARSSFGDGDLRWLASCAALESADLRETSVRDLAGLEAVSQLPAMTWLAPPFRCRVELWLANRSLRGVTPPSDAERAGWRPSPRHDHGPLPPPPAGFARRFVHEVLHVCPDCRGTGRCPDGPCAYHEETREIRYAGDTPFDPAHGTILEHAVVAVARAEALAAELARHLGTPPVIAWRFDRDDPDAFALPPSAFDGANLRRGRLANTVLWPMERHHDAPDEVSRLAVAILDAGFSIAHVGDDAIHLGHHFRSHVT
jgi:hypothetical protein